MAREKVTGFDADSFIESVRESAVPTYHSAKSKQSETKTPQKQENIPKEIPPPDKGMVEESESVEDVFYVPPCETLEDKYLDLNMSETEIDFIKTFIVNHNFRQVNQKGRQILIRKEHCKMIVELLTLIDAGANMATYIDNVLIQHFKQYYPIMVGISKKCPTKF